MTSSEISVKLTHYSNKHIKSLRSVKQRPEPHSKPNGFWVSVNGENDWLSWCKAENFRTGRLTHTTLVTLKPDANILTIANEKELRAFTRRFGHSEYDAIGWGINWRAVSELHDGIVIAPYIWECRLARDTNWYYTWDCASGCLWKAGTVASLEAL